ncbi:MAG: hypothetical protein ACTSR8_13455 [Promethearchaeota archaeon]
MAQENVDREFVINAFQEAKDLIFYIKDREITLEEETSVREVLIDKVKILLTLEDMDPDEKKIVHIILTKLYAWNPFLADFRGVGELPTLIHQITSTLDILIETEEVSELLIKYYKDDGKESIEESSPVNIQLETALEQIENLPSIEQYKGNIIGFINDKGDNIYFIRQEEDMWMIDLPFSEDDDYSHMMSDDSLSTKAVQEIVSAFFTEPDVMKTLRKRLALTEHMKQILTLEQQIGHFANADEISTNLGIDLEEAQNYITLLINSTDYEEREIAMLKQKARYVFKKLPDPNLYALIVNLGMDFYTAKKVGKYLIDIGWISVFPRFPVSK